MGVLLYFLTLCRMTLVGIEAHLVGMSLVLFPGVDLEALPLRDQGTVV